MKIVVTGCPRSGTQYASLLLSALGIPCGHEAVFHPTGYRPQRWDGLQADSSWLAPPYLIEMDEPVVVLHQTRHPLDVIGSLAWSDVGRRDEPHDRFMRDMLPTRQVRGESYEDWLARFWIAWNALCEEASALGARSASYQIEQLTPAALMTMLPPSCGLDLTAEEVAERMHQIPRRVGHLGASRLPADQLSPPVRERLAHAASAYGYTL